MDSSLRCLTHGDYTIACICPMGVELAPAVAMLDEVHQSLPTSRDSNNYTLGRMGVHNIVIAVMPEIGNNNAAAVVTQLLNDFKSVRFGFLVGIGGGIPSDEEDIRLGDVVVSKPTATFGGVVQFDRGKVHPNGKFERTGTLKKPPAVLMASVQRLEAQHRRIGSQISKYLSEMLERFPNMEEEYVYPGVEHDQLFGADNLHKGGGTCQLCDRNGVVERPLRGNTTPRIHYGTIGSANEVIKDSETRDRLRKDLGVLCVEMEAAGLMDEFSCLVIRGICDYADSHKNKIWQPYAAATAAAYAKEMLSIIPAQEIVATAKVLESLRDQSQLLNELPYADGAAFNSKLWEHEPQCLPETRIDLLQQVMAWSEDPNSSSIFWLNGMAGTGKSTIARTVAHAFADRGRLGASFFFSRGRGDLSHATKFFTSLATQLANTLPVLRPYIRRAIDENLNISQQGLSEQWKHLILRPLSYLKDTTLHLRIFVFVVDALDECEGEDDIQLILRLLAEAKALKPVQLRIFITSRPETPIRFGFLDIPEAAHHDFVLHNVPASAIDHDISIFFYHKFEIIRKRRHLPHQWPGEHNVKLLVHKANGLFIYAATTCRFIQHRRDHPQHRLSLILNGHITSQSLTGQLDGMYTQVLRDSVLGDCEEREKLQLVEQFRTVVGSIVILFDSLTVSALAKLLHITYWTAEVTLDSLHSVLDIPEDQNSPIRLLHPSFRDFLLAQQRCLDPQFWIDKEKAHNTIFTNCLELMSNNLREDMCNLRFPGSLATEVEEGQVEKCLPLDVQYACRYWVDHLYQVSHLQQGQISLADNGRVHKFLQDHFLHWLEGLSLMRRLSHGVMMIRQLESMLMPRSSTSSLLLTMVRDAKRFILGYRSIVEKAPLQLYCSALIFSPKRSVIKTLFEKQLPSWVNRSPIVEEYWNPSLQTLEGHSHYVAAVEFSPNGHLLASSSGDGTVRLWDLTTGASRGILEGHFGPITFSPDGRILASASHPKVVRLWDPMTGASRGILEGHSGAVRALAFSPNSQILASSSDEETVRLWDPMTGASRGILKGHSGWVRAVVFSPDGQLLASASYDGTVRLWDPMTGASRGILDGHSGTVRALAFSPNSQILASSSDEETVGLWDPVTGASCGILGSHSGWVRAVAFSPDGQLFASASYDGTARLWDPMTGASRGILEGHSGWVSALAFSPNSQILASASDEGTVRLWDPVTGASRGILEGHSGQVRALAFSPNSQILASSSDDKTVRLWDPTIGVLRSALEGHSKRVRAVAFSPDGQLLASASNDETVRLWDQTTGASYGILEGHSGQVRAVAFSPDGQLLASVSEEVVSLWDSMTGVSYGILEGHPDWVRAVAFSPNGQLLASASDDGTVGLWNLETRVLCGTLEGHSNLVRTVEFSPDGQILASASDDNTVRLWDPETRVSCGTLEGHSDWVRVMAFSPDGQLLASALGEGTVWLWDVKTGETIQTIETGGVVRKLSFASDGSHLVTTRGTLMLNLPTSRDLRFQLNSSLYLDFNQDWITYKNENVLWLPPDYRVSCLETWNNILALGHELGRATFMELDLGSIPLSESSRTDFGGRGA
ncbi:hypothetical protein FGG08_004154 [Glutinoglossum americanum]|uniref:NACHT domain-containing protein n=1 Tax=Glutinoglossum americanum TaxID=1670608 RepID=A0A9P8HWZ3_9PEZI|nr:hypothetical protein FGG08_004154 [Glutinoglossum americanum]